MGVDLISNIGGSASSFSGAKTNFSWKSYYPGFDQGLQLFTQLSKTRGRYGPQFSWWREGGVYIQEPTERLEKELKLNVREDRFKCIHQR